MHYNNIKTAQSGWVSLPIIGLLLAVASISSHYQETLMASYQWRGKLKAAQEEQRFWTGFEQTFVLSANFSQAFSSQCAGFCDLSSAQYGLQEQIWQGASDQPLIFYQWHTFTETEQRVSHRLCASQNQRQYRCWWWRDEQVVATGWVTAGSERL
ncbi:hypothetical protein [Marinomonas algarum]|uniref:DUF2509 family protein n=1 Tax=Marinomonas algarum TaxID=2883105 RepID=A0A9X1ILC7_9GAMM|nr:hypothetical protein [Marinomonas algarum]MCB5161345.1 hypothetical protein [Marinomonas algarum]